MSKVTVTIDLEDGETTTVVKELVEDLTTWDDILFKVFFPSLKASGFLINDNWIEKIRDEVEDYFSALYLNPKEDSGELARKHFDNEL